MVELFEYIIVKEEIIWPGEKEDEEVEVEEEAAHQDKNVLLKERYQ